MALRGYWFVQIILYGIPIQSFYQVSRARSIASDKIEDDTEVSLDSSTDLPLISISDSVAPSKAFEIKKLNGPNERTLVGH